MPLLRSRNRRVSAPGYGVTTEGRRPRSCWAPFRGHWAPSRAKPSPSRGKINFGRRARSWRLS